MTLEDKIDEFVKYLDTWDFIQGDSPCIHICWYRSGNSRRNAMQKNGSSFLQMQCSVIVANLDYVPDKEGFQTKHVTITANAEGALKCIEDCMKKVKEYESVRRLIAKSGKEKKKNKSTREVQEED